MAESLTIRDILNMSIAQRKEDDRFNTKKVWDIAKVEIDGNTFTGYKTFSFIREKSYVKSPERSSSGVIENLNSYSSFLTPHFTIDFSLMSIEDYRRLMELIYSKNEFIVKCFDVVGNKVATEKMYFATEEMPKLWAIARALNGEEWVELLGVQDYTVEMIGTNASFDYVSVVYHFNPPDGSGLTDTTEGEDDVYKGEELIVGQNSSFQNNPPQGYKFAHWVDSNGTKYLDGYTYTINHDIVLYAVWESVEEHTLVFNYGLSTTAVDDTTMEFINSRKVVNGKPIGELPTFESNPTVTYDNKEYSGANSPFYNGEWWKTTTKAKKVDENGTDITDTLKVKSNDLYWLDYDTTIYLLYDKQEYDLEYYIDDVLHSSVKVKYGEPVSLPKLVKSGYNFKGWYGNETFTKDPPSTMPPFPIKLYATWENIND